MKYALNGLAMPSNTPPPDDPRVHAAAVDALTKHSEFLRRIARALVGDDATADDVVQATWLAALRKPPERGGDARPWLARVLRNEVRQVSRSRRRREARELEAASSEPSAESPFESLVEIERQRRLLEAVAALPAAQRNAIVETFFHGRSYADAARTLGVSSEAVRSRVRRGIEAIRLQFAPDEDDARWLLAISGVGVPGPSARSALRATGSTVSHSALWTATLTMKKILVICTALMIVPAIWMVSRPGTDPMGRGVEAPVERATAAIEPEPMVESSARATRAAVPGPANPVGMERTADAEMLHLHVQGIDRDRTTIEGLSGAIFRDSDPDGRITVVAGLAAVDSKSLNDLRTAVANDRRTLRIELDGRPADFEEGTLDGLEDGQPGETLTVRAWLLQPVRLRVVDARDGSDLARVEVRGGVGSRSEQVVPKASAYFVGGTTRDIGDSPLEIEPSSRMGRYWVSAAEHEWRYVEVDHVEGGDRLVRLQPAGELAVRLPEAPDPKLELRVRVYRSSDGDVAVAEADLRFGRTEFVLGRFLAGEWIVRVETAERGSNARVVDEARGTVVPSERLTLDLDLSEFVEPSGVSFEGVVHLDGAPATGARLHARPWPGSAGRRLGDRAAFELRLEPERGIAPFSFEVTPGSWELLLTPYEVSRRYEVSATGLRGAVLEAPPLVDVSVEVREEGSDRALDLDHIRFTTVSRSRAHEGSGMALQRVDAVPGSSGKFRFLAPEGELSLAIPTTGHVLEGHTIEVTAPKSERVVRLRRRARAHLRFVNGGFTVPVRPEHIATVIRSFDEKEIRNSTVRAIESGVARIEVEEEGFHRIEFEAPEGFEKPASIDVEFAVEDPPTVEVVLSPIR